MGSHTTVIAILLIALIQGSFAPPVTQNKETENQEDSEIGGLEDYMEYHRYLKEVVNALESDPDFRQKLEKADEKEIRTGKIADQLEFVSHHVRNRLDEIKRVELQRLRELTEKKRQLMQGTDNEDPNHHGHLDHSNPHTFEINDLKKLIAKTTEDLAEADKKRKEEFKQYELQKEFEKQIKLNSSNGVEREKLEKELKEREEKHKNHEKLHEPGHKAQLEEVWEEQDQMQQEFDPKTFFMLHDVDSNGLWDQDEVKALFVKELEKMYKAGEPEDDMRERAEEMERMRESVFKEVDLNRDGFIDFEEFLAQTRRNDFQQDQGWQGIDEKRPYSDQELAEYIRQHQAYQMQHGYPPHPQGYPGQVPPGAYQQMPAGYHPNAVPQEQYHPGQVPQQQYHPGQVPQQQYHPGQVPQQQYHPGQVPQQQYNSGQVPQQQYHPGQVPQQQYHAGQVPQHYPEPGHLPDLNTNEIYPQQNAHPNQPPQAAYQQPPQASYQHNPQTNYQQPNQHQSNPQQAQQKVNDQQAQNQQPPQQAQNQQLPQQAQYQQPPQQQQQQAQAVSQPPPNHEQNRGSQNGQQPVPPPPNTANNVPNQQNVPAQASVGNSINQGSPQVNQV